MHHLMAERRRRVAHQGDVITKLLGVLRGGLGTSVGEQPDDDNVTDTVLLQLHVEVGIGESAGAPVLLDHDVAGLRREVGMPIPSPFAARKGMALHDGLLARTWVAPGLVIARLPSAMWNDEDLDASTA